MKKIFFLSGMVFLICFSIIFSVENVNGFILGDYIFSKIGIPAWSNGYDGLHYTIFVTILLFILGMLGLGRVKKELNITTLSLIVTFFIIFQFYQPIFNFTYDKVKGLSGGLSSIEHIRKDSRLKIIEEDGLINIEGRFKFHNHSDKEQKFFVKVVESNKEKKINPYFDILEEAIDFEEPKNEVKIPPKIERVVILSKNIHKSKEYPIISGEFTGLDIGIYDQEDQVEFIKNKY